ncbi:aquaporin [Marmoricola endophyticus]|uniref:Aquaporin n=1 Tax=Marmoricola endophyticus TaxID=2040280 RepID=A0A917BDU8_9ACTN|nr:MIP/aquaporin family protein [Marmoricola endophyticus]GGF36826.1 aquaporin [Marmoricola endophyticus]
MTGSKWGDLSAEFLGTMVLILFGCGVVAQVVTGGDAQVGGDHDSIAWAWGFGVTFGIYISARLSGAHLNPAVTLALAVFRGFEWRRVAPYCLAQLLGAFVAAIIVRFVYADQIANVDPSHTGDTQGIFSTSPGPGVSILTAFADQVVGTAILVAVILALTTATNNPPMANIGPLFVGFLVVAIGMAWGTNAGYAINPARDLGPRLASLMTGYGNALNVAGGDTLYFWLPIVAPLVGGLVGGAVFKYLIEIHLPSDPEDVTVAEPVGRTP